MPDFLDHCRLHRHIAVAPGQLRMRRAEVEDLSKMQEASVRYLPCCFLLLAQRFEGSEAEEDRKAKKAWQVFGSWSTEAARVTKKGDLTGNESERVAETALGPKMSNGISRRMLKSNKSKEE